MKRKRIAPHAAVLIESMRDIGYSLSTAVADIIDNSIAAGADNVEILADTDSQAPAIGFVDDGAGMSKDELFEAMRHGSKSRSADRAEYDLGRFGLGLKTASFSQCRRVTVLSRRDGKTCVARWDLDTVAMANDWFVELPSSVDEIRWSDRFSTDRASGTLVVWEKLDRIVEPDDGSDRQDLIRQIDEAASHVELIFHRFLSGEAGLKKIRVLLNGRSLQPFDPFHSKHPATQSGQTEVFRLGGRQISIQPFTLPHHSKVSAEEWSLYAGAEGYVRNQGFYVYRAKRLIIYGTWFSLAKQTELTKLSRVRIDVPNTLDADWKIDVKKSSAQLPAPVRARLRGIIEAIGASSKRVYRGRGTARASPDRLPVWVRTQNKNRVFYGLNRDHPAFSSFADELSAEQQRKFWKLLDLTGSTVPVDALFADMGSNPQEVSGTELEDNTFADLVKSIGGKLRSAGSTYEHVKLMMSSAEPFRSRWQSAAKILARMEESEQ